MKVINSIAAIILLVAVQLPASAVEVIMEEDLVKGIIVAEQFVKVADNAIFLLDTSSSMDKEFGDTGKSKIELVYTAFSDGNRYMPDLGYQFGLYAYTGWKEYYPMQLYNREKFAAALDAVPKKGSGATPLKWGLINLEPLLKPLTGRTAVFVFSDGQYTGTSPAQIARRLASEYDICFYVISTAEEDVTATLNQNVANLNSCSRVIPLEYFLYRPEYTSGALYDVRATETIVTTMETRIAGLEVDNIHFAFDKTELNDKDKSELDELAEFMKMKPESYAVIAGYTDNVGTEDYNEGLSRRRTEMVATYLSNTHGIDGSRMVLQWYGSGNPIVGNDTREGRTQNRRVEVAVGGI